MSVKRCIVIGLEALCTRWDNLPIGRQCWGCYPLRLAERSSQLDERWKTGVWS